MSRGPWIKVTIADPTPLTIIVPRAYVMALKNIAAQKEKGLTVSEICRRAIRRYINDYEAIPYDGSVTGDWPETGGVEADSGLQPPM